MYILRIEITLSFMNSREQVTHFFTSNLKFEIYTFEIILYFVGSSFLTSLLLGSSFYLTFIIVWFFCALFVCTYLNSYLTSYEIILQFLQIFLDCLSIYSLSIPYSILLLHFLHLFISYSYIDFSM